MTHSDSLPTGSHPRIIWTKTQVNSNRRLFAFLAGETMETQSEHCHQLKRTSTTRSTHDPNEHVILQHI